MVVKRKWAIGVLETLPEMTRSTLHITDIMWRDWKCEEMPQKRVWKGAERARRHILGSGAEAEEGRISPDGGKKRLKALKCGIWSCCQIKII